MNAAAFRPVDPIRTMQINSRMAMMAIATGGLYGVLGGDIAGGNVGIYWLVFALAVPVGAVGAPRVWRLFGRSQPWWLVYAWAGLGIVLLSFFVGFVAPGPVELWVLAWALQGVNTEFNIPRKGRNALHALSVVTLLVVLVVHGAPASRIVLDLGMFGVIVWLVGRLARRFRDALDAERRARVVAERNARLLIALAEVNDLDPKRVAEAAADAVQTLGYDMANVGVLDPFGRMLESLATVGFDDSSALTEPLPASEGLIGEVIRRQRTVALPDYQAWPGRLTDRPEVRAAVGVPIQVDGTIRGVLLGMRSTPGAPQAEQIEMIELLAGQVGRVLANADRFDEEHRRVERLQQLDLMKSDFIASVSHELRTPLTVLQGAGQTLERRYRQLSPEQRLQLLDRVHANARRLDRMIAELLEVSRFDAGEVSVRAQGVLVSELVSQVVTRLAPALRDHVVDVQVGDTAVQADPAMMDVVLTSLLGNVVKHTPPGTRARVTAEVEGDHVLMTVADDGPGIDHREIPFILDHFFRGGPSNTRASSGLGLGLAIANRILAEHGAELEVDEAAADGATFRFRLPRAVVPSA